MFNDFRFSIIIRENSSEYSGENVPKYEMFDLPAIDFRAKFIEVSISI